MTAMPNERTTEARARSPVEWFCLLAGLALLVTGLWALALDGLSWSTGGSVNGPEVWGLFEANGWHAVMHIAAGVALLGAMATRATARLAALLAGVLFGAVAVWGFVAGDDILGVFAVNLAGNLLHAVVATLGILAYAASATGRHVRDRTGPRRTANPGGRAERSRLEQDSGIGHPPRR